ISSVPLSMPMPTKLCDTAPPRRMSYWTLLSVSVPNQMHKLCDSGLVVNSAMSVGTLVAKLGVVDDQRPAELCPVSTLMWPGPNAEEAVDCRLGSHVATDIMGQ